MNRIFLLILLLLSAVGITAQDSLVLRTTAAEQSDDYAPSILMDKGTLMQFVQSEASISTHKRSFLHPLRS